jgi:general secretion pathway protein L
MNTVVTSPSLFAQVSHNASTFWRWWTGELSAMVPGRLRMWFAGDSSVVDVAVDAAETGSSLVLVKPESTGLRELKRVVIDSREPARMRGQVDDLLRGYGRDVRLVLAPATVLRKRWSLPLATEENLTDVVGFDMDRQTPFTAAQVYFGARIVNRDVVREKIDVEVAVIPRAAIDGWINDLRASGVSVHSMVSADDLAKSATPIDLLPANVKSEKRWSMMQRLNVGLLAAAFLVALAAVVLPIWQKREVVKEMLPLAVKASSEYATTQRVSEEYTKLANEYNFMLAKKHGSYPVVHMLEELSKAFPDTTWLRSFELKSQAKVRTLELAGEAASVSKVIETLEKTPMFQNTQQRTQTMRGAGNLEQFQLVSELKARPLPEALTTEQAAKAAVPPSMDSAATPNPAAPNLVTPAAAPLKAPNAVPTAAVTAPAAAPAAATTMTAPNPASAAKSGVPMSHTPVMPHLLPPQAYTPQTAPATPPQGMPTPPATVPMPPPNLPAPGAVPLPPGGNAPAAAPAPSMPLAKAKSV